MTSLRSSFLLGLISILLLAGSVACSSTAAPSTSPAPTAAATQAPPTVPAATRTSAATAAATAAPTTAPTTAPTSAPSAGAQIAFQAPDKSIQVVDASGRVQTLAPEKDPVDLVSIYSGGNVVGTSLYLPFSGQPFSVVRIDAKGAQTLKGVQGPINGLAASDKYLAWGTTDMNASPIVSTLWVGGPDGSQPKPALQDKFTGIPQSLSPMRWSRDGTRLYFGKEPNGLGGYILFGGRTNLWTYDVTTGKSAELLPPRANNAFVCIDDLSPDEKRIADHCTIKSMELVDLATKKATPIQPPSGVPQFGAVGGARFSPDSSRLAYALARHDPENEQGWVAVTDGLAGPSKLITTSPAKDYFAVVGWLDAKTLVLQSNGTQAGIWTVGADGTNLKRLADGTFLGILGAR